MRFYTGKLEGTQLLFAGFEKDPFLYKIEDYGMKFSDMTELVCTITDEQKDRLLNEREGKRAYALDEIQILPPIVRPRQDVVCLGINYSEHAKEASAFSKEAFTKDKPYMIQTIGGAVEELSEGMTLLAGTLIATGTPAGVGMGFNPPKFLKTGDKVICEIDKIGRLENTIGE